MQIPVTVDDEVIGDDLVPTLVEDLGDVLINRIAVEDEIDMMLRTVRGFWQFEPDQVLRLCGAMSARCTELCVHLHRVEGDRKRWGQIRTQQVERLLSELDRQFKISSRLIEVRRQDISMER